MKRTLLISLSLLMTASSCRYTKRYDQHAYLITNYAYSVDIDKDYMMGTINTRCVDNGYDLRDLGILKNDTDIIQLSSEIKEHEESVTNTCRTIQYGNLKDNYFKNLDEYAKIAVNTDDSSLSRSSEIESYMNVSEKIIGRTVYIITVSDSVSQICNNSKERVIAETRLNPRLINIRVKVYDGEHEHMRMIIEKYSKLLKYIVK